MNRPKIEYVDVDGVRLRVATQAGSGGGVPLLIFNGIGANFELVFPFMEAMDGIEMIIFDIPGIGRSEMSWKDPMKLTISPLEKAATSRKRLKAGMFQTMASAAISSLRYSPT